MTELCQKPHISGVCGKGHNAIERTIAQPERATAANIAKAQVLERYAAKWRIGFSPFDDVADLRLFLSTIDGGKA